MTDLDGTLWGPDEVVHEDTLAAIADLAERGTELLVATGRRPRSAQAVLERLGLAPPAVLLDGALGVELGSGDVFHRHDFDPDDAAAVLAAFLDEDVEPVVYVEEGDVETLIGQRPSTHPEHLRRLGPAALRCDLELAVRSHRILSFGVIGGDPARLERIAARLDGIAQPTITRDLVFGGATLMVPPRGIDKWEGVVAWCARRGLDVTRVLAIGDGTNDLGLLRRAAVACSVADGSPDALDACDHILPPPHLGGWSGILELLDL